jgi:hypothetical protein
MMIKLEEMKKRLDSLQMKLYLLEDSLIMVDYFSVIAYAKMKMMSKDEYDRADIEIKATNLSEKMGIPIKLIMDSKYGLIRTYSEEVLDTLYVNDEF